MSSPTNFIDADGRPLSPEPLELASLPQTPTTHLTNSSDAGELSLDPEPAEVPLPETPPGPTKTHISMFSTRTNGTTESSSPMKDSAQDPISKTLSNDQRIQEMRRAIVRELGSPVEAELDWAKELYASIATDSEIDAFLQKTDHYDYASKEWILKRTGPGEKGLYHPFAQVLQAIIDHFNQGKPKHEVINTKAARFYHGEEGASDMWTSPDISILARPAPEGSTSSFQEPRRKSKPGKKQPGKKQREKQREKERIVGYSNLVSIVEVKVDSKLPSVESNMGQLGVYARQVMIQQPNRRYFRALIATEKRYSLYHLDRSGCQHTRLADINYGKGGEDVRTFIRLVLGLSSTDEKTVGLDPSVKWKIDGEDRKVSGTITVRDEDGKEREYDLVRVDPVFLRPSIRGRGTTCWHATEKGKPDKEVFIKMSWRSKDRTPEYVYLKEAKGVVGIGQMITYDPTGEETKSFRGSPSSKSFFNRVAMCVVLECYGDSVFEFNTQTQAIAAIRDTLSGYKSLSEDKEIIHRDISKNNVLLGKQGASKGWRGVLIDLDMAARKDRTVDEVSQDHRTGTRMYMSTAVLASFDPRNRPSPPHNVLDDLESIHYVLTELMFGFEGPHKLVAERPQLLVDWQTETHHNALNSKNSYFINEDLNTRKIPGYWLPACKALLCGLHKLLAPVVKKKNNLFALETEEDREDLRILLEGSSSLYQSALDLFDKALEDLKDAEIIPAATEPSTPPRRSSQLPADRLHISPNAAVHDLSDSDDDLLDSGDDLRVGPPAPGSSSTPERRGKRGSQGDVEDSPSAKRMRTRSTTRNGPLPRTSSALSIQKD
ncbi:hypothetical protein DFP72DRAFT_921126 [Ephemerocybe angulata]|uniref:Fungal-type protein kinase domain-containing protein n=1 Tax=Ephemerocybe angulata TaxID=980116 RepID=A0A8H6HIZ1_9AGAR|nr:hypothetical protein DFP72DRAFT_921126 [Tulosesus angulatus]